MRERFPRPVALLAALALAGCMVHLERNAPGHVDLAAPPTAPAEQVEEPGDPGENMITLSSGLGLGGGGDFGGAGSSRGAFKLTLETTLHFGDRAFSHDENPPFIPLATNRYYPDRSLGLSLGWHALDTSSGRVATGPLYLEAQGFMMEAYASGVGVGWAVDPRSGHHGPQVTLFGLAVFTARYLYLAGVGHEIAAGIQFKFPVTWVWSR